jgi:hypothetical protein
MRLIFFGVTAVLSPTAEFAELKPVDANGKPNTSYNVLKINVAGL